MNAQTSRAGAPGPAPQDVCEAFARDWLACTLRTYPEHTGRLLRDEGSRFRNPVGSTLREALAGLTGELFGAFEPRRVTAWVDAVVRLRAVQDFSPADVTAFVAFARQAADRLADPGQPGIEAGRLDLLQQRIDALGPIAEGCLAQCREDLRAIGERAARRRVFVMERLHARTAARAAGDVAVRPPASRGGLP